MNFTMKFIRLAHENFIKGIFNKKETIAENTEIRDIDQSLIRNLILN